MARRFKISLPAHGRQFGQPTIRVGFPDMDAVDANALVYGVWTHLVMVR
ncbi:MAG: hypothetical protein IPL23_26820 [Saprospiraceae bacterium]|nr:hypothetical protein [Saprospiraceae bacterium]